MMNQRTFRWTMVTNQIDQAHPVARKDVAYISAMMIGNRMMRIKTVNKASIWMMMMIGGHIQVTLHG